MCPFDTRTVQRRRPLVPGLRPDQRRGSAAAARARRRTATQTDIPGRRRETRRPRHQDALDVVRGQARRLTGDPAQYQSLIDGVRDARVVLLGEATHGTHEFYRERAFITRRLIAECGFTAVAVEADWPDAYRVNRYVRGDEPRCRRGGALKDFGRFPTWMWRNADVLDFVGWLRDVQRRPAREQPRRLLRPRSLQPARVERRRYWRISTKVDPDAAARARARYALLRPLRREMQQYGYAAAFRRRTGPASGRWWRS